MTRWWPRIKLVVVCSLVAPALGSTLLFLILMPLAAGSSVSVTEWLVAISSGPTFGVVLGFLPGLLIAFLVWKLSKAGQSAVNRWMLFPIVLVITALAVTLEVAILNVIDIGYFNAPMALGLAAYGTIAALLACLMVFPFRNRLGMGNFVR